ncbi:hypothetical protein AAFC00_005425 [Neodothiora populina]|uniref:NADH dehydrogenase [ubiquinone] 1 beta subcomplex subunit 11, mitochondrial n=1 Tax=Neodothiora populina TaxID=2781224 RepID=A0ABR3PKU7_9PEZI
MQSLRSTFARRAKALQTSVAIPRTMTAQRHLSITSQLRSAESHGDHYNPPGGWLFGVKPGEKYENEGWEKIWYWGFFAPLALCVIGYCYKPDTSIQTWALEEARRRLEAEGILADPETSD